MSDGYRNFNFNGIAKRDAYEYGDLNGNTDGIAVA